jgi:hypothetical protein
MEAATEGNDKDTTPAGDEVKTATGGNPERVHRVLVPTLLVLATVVGFLAAFAVWVNRQALNTDNWSDTSSELLENEEITQALGVYLVNELYTNVDVPGAIEAKLPPQLAGFAGPAAAAVRDLANRAAPQLLASPKVQDVWTGANTAAHKQLLKIVNGGGDVVSTEGGVVTLNLRTLVAQLAANLGVEDQVEAAQEKLQGSGGDQARAAAEARGITLPPETGELVIMRSTQLETAQDVAGSIKGLALVLPMLMIALFAGAVWLARGRRRLALRTSGWCFVVIGVLLLLLRRVVGNAIVDSLVKVPSNETAVHEVWKIATSLLYAIAVALIVYGIVIVLAAWLAGPTRAATSVRQGLAPNLRDRPGMAYAAVGGVLLLLIAWGPTPAFRQLAWIALFAALLALGLTMLRRQTALEFPEAEHGDVVGQMRDRIGAARARRATAKAPAASPGRSTPEEIERLVALHDSGNLNDEEFAAAKSSVVNGG